MIVKGIEMVLFWVTLNSFLVRSIWNFLWCRRVMSPLSLFWCSIHVKDLVKCVPGEHIPFFYKPFLLIHLNPVHTWHVNDRPFTVGRIDFLVKEQESFVPTGSSVNYNIAKIDRVEEEMTKIIVNLKGTLKPNRQSMTARISTRTVSSCWATLTSGPGQCSLRIDHVAFIILSYLLSTTAHRVRLSVSCSLLSNQLPIVDYIRQHHQSNPILSMAWGRQRLSEDNNGYAA